MRHVTLAAFIALVTAGPLGGRAFAAPFEPGTIPEQVQAVGHLDVDALRKTQIFSAVGGQAAIDAVLDDTPSEMRPLARSLARSLRGVSFWRGASTARSTSRPATARASRRWSRSCRRSPQQTIDGWQSYTIGPWRHAWLVRRVR